MPSALVTPPVLEQLGGEHVRILEAGGFTVKTAGPGARELSADQVADALSGYDAVLAGPEPYHEVSLAKNPQLRVIARVGVGYDSVDVASATRHGVAVTVTPGTNHEAVAEHALTMLLGISRLVLRNHGEVMKGGFTRQVMQPLRRRTLGIVGLGRIGQAVATRALAFQMKVVAYDPQRPAGPSTDVPGVEVVSLDDLLAHADAITLHAPLIPETKRIIGPATIAKMKPGVFFVNTARGGLVDEQALAAALHDGKIAAAGIDVFEKEPPEGSPLLAAPNVLFSPHVGSIDVTSLEDMANLAARTVVELFQGAWPNERIVNAADLGEGWCFAP